MDALRTTGIVVLGSVLAAGTVMGRSGTLLAGRSRRPLPPRSSILTRPSLSRHRHRPQKWSQRRAARAYPKKLKNRASGKPCGTTTTFHEFRAT